MIRTGARAASLLAAVAGLLIFAAFRVGLVRGFDHAISAEGYQRLAFGLDAAIARMDYGIGGYVFNQSIAATLASGGFSADPAVLAGVGTTFPDNLHDAHLLDAAIARATHLPATIEKEPVITFVNDDLGIVDFSTISFALFGSNLLSLYLTYFLLFAISACVYGWTFRGRIPELSLLVVVLAAHYVVLCSPLFDSLGNQSLASVNNPRFLSVLGIIPTLHIVLATIDGLPLRRRQVAAVLAQSLLLSLAIEIRASASWTVLTICLAAIAVLLRLRKEAPRPTAGSGTLAVAGRLGRRLWPVLASVAVVIAAQLYLSAALDQAYRRDGASPHHVVWHAIFYSLQFNPAWEGRFASQYTFEGRIARGDDLPLAASLDYLRRHPPIDRATLFEGGSLRVTARETYARKAFFEFVLDHPRYVFETFFIFKPLYAVTDVTDFIKGSLHRLSRLSLTVLAISCFTCALSLLFSRGRLVGLSLLLSAVALISLLPNLASVVTPAVMAEQLLLITAASLAWAVVFLTLLLTGGGRLLPQINLLIGKTA
jgi:hypothetical protein